MFLGKQDDNPSLDSDKKHEVVMAALACIRCSCSWTYKAESLKGKTDSDLALECGLEFTRHKKAQGDI